MRKARLSWRSAARPVTGTVQVSKRTAYGAALQKFVKLGMASNGDLLGLRSVWQDGQVHGSGTAEQDVAAACQDKVAELLGVWSR